MGYLLAVQEAPMNIWDLQSTEIKLYFDKFL